MYIIIIIVYRHPFGLWVVSSKLRVAHVMRGIINSSKATQQRSHWATSCRKASICGTLFWVSSILVSRALDTKCFPEDMCTVINPRLSLLT